MNRLIILLISLNIHVPSFAQTGKGRYIPNSQLILTGYGGLIFNNVNVANNNIHPNPINAPTAFTFDSKIVFDFQRTTSYRMIYGFGVEFGTERQNFDLIYNSFDFIDTASGLRNASASKTFRNQGQYWGARFTIGYLYPVKSKNRNLFDLEAKLTVTKRFMKKGGDVSYELAVGNISNDTIQLYRAVEVSGLWGNRNVPNGGLLFTELDVGIRKRIDWLKNDVYFGAYSSWKTFSFSKDIEVTNWHYLNGGGQYYDNDYYTGIDFTLGFKLGIGLKL